MAISASEIVQVVPRVLSGTGKDLTFNGLFLTQNKILLTGKATAFSSASAVGDFFGFKTLKSMLLHLYISEAIPTLYPSPVIFTFISSQKRP